MRYIGNKENIVQRIYEILDTKGIKGESFFDFCSGTASVAKFFKQKDYRVVSSDLMYMSYCLQKAYIENNTKPEFQSLLPLISDKSPIKSLFFTPLEIVLSHLDTLLPIEGFIFSNYSPEGTQQLEIPRKYFTGKNAGKIDAIREEIEKWKNNCLITENEYFILLSCLLETVSFYSNVAGVYSAFHKKWDPRAIKTLELRPIKIISNNQQNKSFNSDSMKLLEEIEVDILYLDPPYNERQYPPNYHILETIARADSPTIHGISGMRDYKDEKSRFCNPVTALEDLKQIARKAKCKYIVLSYNSEGIMKQNEIVETLSQYGDVEFEEFEYQRFKSNNNGLSRTKKSVFEQVYILKKSL
ncbi:MAG: DNA adenine methylase [Candidatus Onthomorpha sp.]